MFPCPPLPPELLLCLPWPVVSRKLSRALKLRDTATFVHVSLAESTLELPKMRPHLPPAPRADGGPDAGDGQGDGAVLMIRESSVSVNLAGS